MKEYIVRVEWKHKGKIYTTDTQSRYIGLKKAKIKEKYLKNLWGNDLHKTKIIEVQNFV